ncbi:hypothetical protein HHK36_023882 [Tetracentron sinense]|uniref:Uncharacterized protein n=1 Tax=Tetracentron sinense TaxID=13715 RepID=A0A835D694_TETSI|nr:hypothetical protein HHK36_023882 [Tetracentron sinense]
MTCIEKKKRSPVTNSCISHLLRKGKTKKTREEKSFDFSIHVLVVMANLPQSLSLNPPFGGSNPSSANPTVAQPNKDRKLASAEQLVLELSNPDLRENALHDLSKEIVSIYPVLSPPTLTPGASNRVCNALALLQCVASHSETRMLFLNAHIPLYLYPFLNTTSKTRPFEYLRLTSLGVIGALVKVDDTEVISFLLSTEIIPLCLRTMEMGSELSKTVATFIVQKILLDDVGLRYICATAERFFAVGRVLATMVASLVEQPSPRLLKHIIRCYLRLSDNARYGHDPSVLHCRACEALRNCLPDMLRDATFSNCLRDDQTTKRWLQQLIHNVTGGNRVAALQAGGGFDHMLIIYGAPSSHVSQNLFKPHLSTLVGISKAITDVLQHILTQPLFRRHQGRRHPCLHCQSTEKQFFNLRESCMAFPHS